MISQSTIDQVNSSAKIEEVVYQFVKDLKKDGSRFKACCPFHDEKTPSFYVTPSMNIYKCYGCSAGGDSVTFLMEHEKLSYPDAIRYLANKYNIIVEETTKDGKPIKSQPVKASTVKSQNSTPMNREPLKKEYIKPTFKGTPLTEPTINWFKERRHISKETLDHFQVTEGTEWMPKAKEEINVIMFNYYLDEQYINTKYRGPKKDMKSIKDAEYSLYGIDHVKHSEEIAITEGENDALAVYEAGFRNVVSVPGGAKIQNNNFDYLEKIYDTHLKNKKKIYIITDNDEPGAGLREDLLRLFGREISYVVDVPKIQVGETQDSDGNTVPIYTKDANDILIHQGKKALLDLIKNAKGYDIPGVYNVADLESVMWQRFENKEFYPKGSSCYIPDFEPHWSWRKGDINVAIGPANQGKSAFFCNTLPTMKAMNDGDVWAVWGPEQWPAEDFFDDIIHTYIGQSTDPHFPAHQMSRSQYQQGLNFSKNHYYYVYPEEEHDYNTIFDKFKSMIIKHNVTGVIIDPVNQLERTGDDSKIRDDQYLSRFYSKLKRFLISHGLYCMVITHCAQRTDQDGMVLKPNWISDTEGGPMTSKKVDNMLYYYRPYFVQDIRNSLCVIGSGKIKKHKLTGSPGWAEFTFDKISNRYFSATTGKCVMDEDFKPDTDAQHELFPEPKNEPTKLQEKFDVPDELHEREGSWKNMPRPNIEDDNDDLPF